MESVNARVHARVRDVFVNVSMLDFATVIGNVRGYVHARVVTVAVNFRGRAHVHATAATLNKNA